MPQEVGLEMLSFVALSEQTVLQPMYHKMWDNLPTNTISFLAMLYLIQQADSKKTGPVYKEGTS